MPLIKSLSVHWERVSDPVPSYCRFPSCLRRSLLLLHPGLPPSASARQPQERWLDSREASILQPRQSRLHRWVTIKHARLLQLLRVFFSGDEKHRLLRLCGFVFGIVFFFLFFFACLFWRRSCVLFFFFFSCKRHFLQPSMQYTHKTRMPEGSGEICRGLIRAVVS